MFLPEIYLLPCDFLVVLLSYIFRLFALFPYFLHNVTLVLVWRIYFNAILYQIVFK